MESENPFLLENAMNEWSSQGMHDSRADSVSDSVPYRPSSSLSSSSHHRYYHSTYDQLGPFDYSESTFLSAISDPSAHQRMEDSPRLVMHFLKQGLEQVHNSTIRPMMENGVIQLNALSQQHRQQQQHDQFTSIPPLTELANIEANNVNMSGNNSVNQFDESVFSLLTIRNALIITFYSLIIVVSLTGNLLVCKVAFGSREMRTTTNLLIASLACSDIVMTDVFELAFAYLAKQLDWFIFISSKELHKTYNTFELNGTIKLAK
ncbi:neuropeptide Y receptor [Blomia tropicalis]|nr:neuropeptide Y receptor [Blomia tropicalis]